MKDFEDYDYDPDANRLRAPPPPIPARCIEAMNALTARWASIIASDKLTVFSAVGVWVLMGVLATSDKLTVFSAVGVWVLTGVLAMAATGEARVELAKALGIPAEQGHEAALVVLEFLNCGQTSSALGFWILDRIQLRPEWVDSMPVQALHRLTGNSQTDQKAIDAWACEVTDGMIPKAGVEITQFTQAMLANALTLKMGWTEKFYQRGYSEGQPCEGVFAPPTTGLRPPLERTTGQSHIIRASDEVTTVCVEGDGDWDVHLVLGREGAPATTALPLGIAAIQGAVEQLNTDTISRAHGPGITTQQVQSSTYWDCDIELSVPAFSLTAHHELKKERPEVFGLQFPSTTSNDFPGMAYEALSFGSVRQTAFVEFTADGFSAAAITIDDEDSGFGGLPTPKEITHLSLTIDRPFGFIASHSTTGLVLFAGWITEQAMLKNGPQTRR